MNAYCGNGRVELVIAGGVRNAITLDLSMETKSIARNFWNARNAMRNGKTISNIKTADFYQNYLNF